MVEKVTLPNEQFLQKDFIEARIVSIMNPELEWLGFMNKVQSNSKAIWATKEIYNAKNDPKVRKPRLRTSGSKFAQVSVSQLTEVSTTMATEGLEIRIDEDAIRYTEGIDEIDRAYTKAAYWLVDSINSQFGAALSSGVYQGDVAENNNFSTKATPVWSAVDTRNCVGDLMLLAMDVERDDYPYELTDVYLNKTNYWELMQFLTTLKVGVDEKKEIWGMPDMKTPVISIPVLGGVKVHKVRQAITEGALLGLDTRFSPATFYYGVNPRYPQSTANNMGFHVNRYVEESSHDTVIQMWLEFGILVKETYAGIYRSTGI
jgi:hypothetical protein